MHPASRRAPAILPGSALLAGLWLGSAGVAPMQPILGWPSALIVVLLLWRRGGRPTAAPAGLFVGCALLLAAGLGLAAADREQRQQRLARLAPRDGNDLHLVGSVLGTAEPTLDGGRSLTLRAAPQDSAEYERYTVRLIIRPSPLGATARVDELSTGDAIRVWCRLYRPRRDGNPASRDPGVTLAALGVDAYGSVKSARLVERLRVGSSPWRRFDALERRARHRLNAVLGEQGDERALLGALLLGDRSALSGRAAGKLREAGMLHLVAISGLHVGLLMLVVLATGRRVRLPRWLFLALMLGLLTGFTYTVGARVSVLRAACGFALWQWGRALGRDGCGMNSLVVVAALLAASRPAAVLGAGFQLTFVATAGLLLATARTSAALPLAPWPARAVAVSGSAYLATAPLVARWFGHLAPIGLLSNLVAAPLCAAVLLSGYLTLTMADLPLVGDACAALTRASARALLLWAEQSARVGAAWVVVPPSTGVVAMFYACAVLAVSPRRLGGRGCRRTATAALALTTLWIHTGPPPPGPPTSLVAAAIDVGQGQAVAVRTPDGGVLIFDAAGRADPRFDPGERVVVPFLLRFAGRRVEGLWVSHEHVDHAGGAGALLRRMEVGELWMPAGFHRSPRLSDLAALARVRGVPLSLGERGVRRRRAGVELQILGPARDDGLRNANDRSQVVLLGRSPCRLLVPGDLERDGEAALVGTGLDLRAEALIVSHHGSRHGSTWPFLQQVRPTWAVISCGRRNRFGHPHAEVLRRLAASDARVRRTDLDGMVQLHCEPAGWTWSVRSGRAASP